jgi:hypothetical protein
MGTEVFLSNYDTTSWTQNAVNVAYCKNHPRDQTRVNSDQLHHRTGILMLGGFNQPGGIYSVKPELYQRQPFFRHDPIDRAKVYHYPPQPRKKTTSTRYAPYPTAANIFSGSRSLNLGVPTSLPNFQSNRTFELVPATFADDHSSPSQPRTHSRKYHAKNDAKTAPIFQYYAQASNMRAYTQPINDFLPRTSVIPLINCSEPTGHSYSSPSEENASNIHMPTPVSAALSSVLSIGRNYDNDAVSESSSLPPASKG